MFRVAPYIRFVFVLVLGLAAQPQARAAEIAVTTCVAPAALADDPGAFSCEPRQTAHGQGDFAVRLDFAPVESRAADPLVLRFAAIWRDGANIQFRYADGQVRQTGYTAADAARRMAPGGVLQFTVPPRPAPLADVRIAVTGAANYRGVLVGAEIMPSSLADRQNHVRLAAYAAFGGLVLALLVFNISLWMALRHRFQLHYCAMLCALGVYAASASGLLGQLLPSVDANDRLRINIAMLGLFAVSALYFVRRFFDDAAFGAGVNRLIAGVSLCGLVSALAFAALAPWQAGLTYRAFSAAMIVMVLALLPILASAWRSQSRYVGLFALAWSLPAVIALLRGAHGLGLLGYSFLLDNGNLLALAVESLCSTLIVNARVRELSLQRDSALAGERIARRLAGTDPLTGLLNRRSFLDLAIGRETTHRLMLIDVDRFKQVNDQLGHDAGDEVLVAIAGIIQQCRPQRSLAVRLGGEEFAILVPVRAGRACPADDLLQAVRCHSMPQGARVTISIGIADGPVRSEEDWKRLYRLADAALYRAKEDGRDRACRVTDFRMVA